MRRFQVFREKKWQDFEAEENNRLVTALDARESIGTFSRCHDTYEVNFKAPMKQRNTKTRSLRDVRLFIGPDSTGSVVDDAAAWASVPRLSLTLGSPLDGSTNDELARRSLCDQVGLGYTEYAGDGTTVTRRFPTRPGLSYGSFREAVTPIHILCGVEGADRSSEPDHMHTEDAKIIGHSYLKYEVKRPKPPAESTSLARAAEQGEGLAAAWPEAKVVKLPCGKQLPAEEQRTAMMFGPAFLADFLIKDGTCDRMVEEGRLVLPKGWDADPDLTGLGPYRRHFSAEQRRDPLTTDDKNQLSINFFLPPDLLPFPVEKVPKLRDENGTPLNEPYFKNAERDAKHASLEPTVVTNVELMVARAMMVNLPDWQILLYVMYVNILESYRNLMVFYT